VNKFVEIRVAQRSVKQKNVASAATIFTQIPL